MDYMGELLRRQRDALTALLLGGETEETRAGDGGTVENAVYAGAARSMETEGDLARSAGAEETVPAAGGYRERERETSMAAPGRTRRELVTRDAAGEWGTVWSPDSGFTGWGGTWPTGSSAVGESGVREVSRAIQRDARRYDGGFSIY